MKGEVIFKIQLYCIECGAPLLNVLGKVLCPECGERYTF